MLSKARPKKVLGAAGSGMHAVIYNSSLFPTLTVVDKSLLSTRCRLPPSTPHRRSFIFVSFISNSSWVVRSVLQQQDWFSDS
ncbi:hypothetical protein QYF36_009732 [Acer negundo]|nr:hypothetical protein QYF36_009732 [Acer negundo]